MKRILSFFMCASIAAACMRQEMAEVAVPVPDDKVYASIEGIDTRVQLNADRQTVWTAQDTILVISPDKWAYYTFDGKTGDRNGSFSLLLEDEEYVPGDHGFKNHVAIYSYACSEGFSIGTDGTHYLYARVSNVQKYLKGSYGLHANAMVGTSNDGGRTFNFVNLYGYLRLSLTGSRAVRSITLWDNTYSAIAGSFYFSLDEPDELFVYDNYSDWLALDCGEDGVQLSGEPTDFYFALPPVKMAEGLGVTVQFTDGTEFYQMTDKEIVIERNTIQPMRTLDTDHNYDWQYVRISHTGAYAVSPWLKGASSMSGYFYWGDGGHIYVDLYSWNHWYEDGEESHEMILKVHDAEEIVFNGLTGVKKIDLSEF